MKRPYPLPFLLGSLAGTACLLTILAFPRQVEAAEPPPPADLPSFSGVYPHLAALADSYSESGIGAVVPWADRLWYVSYVAHKAGEGVGLFEIAADLSSIHRRPESVVGTHANRMIHRESQQLIIGPYAIDREGNVRVFEDLTGERLTATMRHLSDPENMVYFQAMEGNFYEADVHTLTARRLFDLREVLEMQGRAHFKGGYTAQGRVVVANNSYGGRDVGSEHPAGPGAYPPNEGRLAEWDGSRWQILHRTAFCDVTTAAGIEAVPDDDRPLYAVGWDRRSILLDVLTGGEWTTYRLPKASHSYDHGWCTEWPRIRAIAPGKLMLDMHGLFYTLSPDFGAGNAGGLEPMVTHLKMVPDFTVYGDRLVLAGNENSVLGHGDRFGGQPQSNLWFGTLDELRLWGDPGGWSGPWLRDAVSGGQPSDPFFIGGFPHRVLHVRREAAPMAPLARCGTQFQVTELPAELRRLTAVSIDRGPWDRPAPPFAFTVDRAVVVYLAVHDRGTPTLPDGWERTALRARWQAHTGFSDTIYRREFPAGRVDLPGHDGYDAEGDLYGVPHLALLRAREDDGPVAVEPIPGQPEVHVVDLPAAADSPGAVDFRLEVDRRGTGQWEALGQIEVAPEGYAHHILPTDLDARWMRIVPEADVSVSAQFHFTPQYRDREPERRFAALPAVDAEHPRIDGAAIPFADRLWMVTYASDAEGNLTGGGLYEVDEDVRPVRRKESIEGSFANRKIVAGQLSLGPHLIDEGGTVRTVAALGGEKVASVARHREPDRVYYLTLDGRLIDADLATLQAVATIDVPAELELAEEDLLFQAAHNQSGTVIVAARSRDGRSGLLAEWDGAAWTSIDRRPFAEVSNLGAMSEQVVALGWDEASALVRRREGAGRWRTYRLPKAEAAYDTAGVMPGPRLREVVTERLLMDHHGLFYEVSGLPYAWSIRPIATHGKRVSEFGSWRGMLMLFGVDAAAGSGGNVVRSGEAALWLGTVDDLWRFGRPRGSGGPWKETAVTAGEPSDPFLMTCFEHQRLVATNHGEEVVTIHIEIDATVDAAAWGSYARLVVDPGASAEHVFPAGFAAHWARLTVDRAAVLSAEFEFE